MPSLPAKIKILLKTVKKQKLNVSRSALFYMKTRVSLKYFVNDCRYSIQSRDQIFVKRYEFLCFAKNMGKNLGKNKRKNLSGKYSQKLLDHNKQSVTDAFETASKRAIEKTAEATRDLIDNEIAYKITEISKNPQQNNSETVTNQHDKEILKERHISLEERQ